MICCQQFRVPRTTYRRFFFQIVYSSAKALREKRWRFFIQMKRLPAAYGRTVVVILQRVQVLLASRPPGTVTFTLVSFRP